MSAITLPSSPSNGQTHEHLGQIFVFDSTRGYWLLKHEKAFPSTTSRSTFTATAGQTSHNVNYDSSQSIIIIVNGVVLNPQDFTATNGTSITFDTALTLSDEVDIIFHKPTTATLSVNYNDLTNKPTIPADVSDLTDSTGLLSSGVTVYADMAGLIAATGMSAGDQALVTATNNIYVYTGAGWFKIATVQNDSPTAITGVNGTYELAVDGSPTTITAVSTDPEGFPLTWSYSTTGLGSIATVSNTNGVFTITPSTVEANAGTFTLTISVTDGTNGAVSASTNLTLNFIVIITDSRYTTLLATATSTGDNNDITDSSSSNNTITANGDAHAGTFSPYRHGGYSTAFNETGGAYLTVPNSSDFNLTNQSFHISFWCYPTALGDYDTIISNLQTMAIEIQGNSMRLWLRTSSSGSWDLTDAATISATLNLYEWTYITVVRDASNNTLKSYQDGTLVYNNTSFTGTVGNSTAAMTIGKYTGTSNIWNGYIRDLKYRVGTGSENTSNSLPTEPITVGDSLTKLFVCHAPNIIDGSADRRTVTPYGDLSVLPLSPYDNVEYDPTVHGGSISFDGSGDYLTWGSGSVVIPSGGNDFTLEFWAYITNIFPSHTFIDFDMDNYGGFKLFYNAGSDKLQWRTYADSINMSTTNVFQPFVWNHVALTRDNYHYRLFVNGVLEGNSTTGIGITQSAFDNGRIGSLVGAVGSNPLEGFISDVRWNNSTAHYTAAFTPPTAPLSSSGAGFHIKGTDASFVDKSQNANLRLYGATTDPVVSAAIADPFGGNDKSLLFDGGDILYATSEPIINQNYVLGTGDFTIEKWIQFTSFGSGDRVLWDFRPLTTNGDYMNMYQNAGVIKVYVGTASGNTLVADSALSLNTWYHIAVSRSGTSKKLFINGNQSGSTYNDSINYLCGNTSYPNRPVIGNIGYNTSYSGYGMHAYLYDFRISKGLARYTSNFSVPTESLKG